MSDLARQLFGDDVQTNPLAVIVDLDETPCTNFDLPILAGVELLRRIDRARVEVHYVTARTEVGRKGTESFLEEHRLPGWRNVHYCPNWQGSRRHKIEAHAKLAKHYRVIASIGDSDEEAEAARLAGIPFVPIDTARHRDGWAMLAELVAAVKGFIADPTPG